MQATTLQCQVDNQYGYVVPEMFYKPEPNCLPENVIFYKRGDRVDLNRVNMESFIAGMTSPEVRRHLTETKALAVVQVEVSEAIADAVRNGLAKYNTLPKPLAGAGVTDGYEVVTLEPGIQVAVGRGVGVVEQPQPSLAEVLTPAPQSVAAAIEPGVVAPVSAKVTEVDTTPDVADWKADKTFDAQKKFLQASTDVDFLTSVANDPSESLKLKKVAKERLAALKANP